MNTLTELGFFFDMVAVKVKGEGCGARQTRACAAHSVRAAGFKHPGLSSLIHSIETHWESSARQPAVAGCDAPIAYRRAPRSGAYSVHHGLGDAGLLRVSHARRRLPAFTSPAVSRLRGRWAKENHDIRNLGHRRRYGADGRHFAVSA
jgi:hypothetical protein